MAEGKPNFKYSQKPNTKGLESEPEDRVHSLARSATIKFAADPTRVKLPATDDTHNKSSHGKRCSSWSYACISRTNMSTNGTFDATLLPTLTATTKTVSPTSVRSEVGDTPRVCHSTLT